MQRVKFQRWYSELIIKAKNSQFSKIIKYTRKTELNADTAMTESLKIWIYKYKEFCAKVDKHVENNDIRQFFSA